MSDFGVDSSITRSEAGSTATLSDRWEIWGPQGGYLAAVALRGAGARSAHPRPASLTCHFLRTARFGEIGVHVASLRRARRAESLRVTLVQEAEPVLEALVWTVTELSGLDHDAVAMPEVPPPQAVEPWDVYLPGGEPPFPFWRNFDIRPVVPHPSAWDRATEPRTLAWTRLLVRPPLDDPFVDAGRLVMIADALMFPAATLAHDGPFPYIAPSLDLTMSFHGPGAESEWLLVEAAAPLSRGALVAGTARVWSGGASCSARPRSRCCSGPEGHRSNARELSRRSGPLRPSRSSARRSGPARPDGAARPSAP